MTQDASLRFHLLRDTSGTPAWELCTHMVYCDSFILDMLNLLKSASILYKSYRERSSLSNGGLKELRSWITWDKWQELCCRAWGNSKYHSDWQQFLILEQGFALVLLQTLNLSFLTDVQDNACLTKGVFSSRMSVFQGLSPLEFLGSNTCKCSSASSPLDNIFSRFHMNCLGHFHLCKVRESLSF